MLGIEKLQILHGPHGTNWWDLVGSLCVQAIGSSQCYRKVNDTESLVVPGHDVVALFAKDDKCAISFSGTHGLADWSTNFNAILGRSGRISVE